jgi:hypothetical protein
MNNTVYVIQEALGKNISDAKRFGQIKVLCPTHVDLSPWSAIASLDFLRDQLKDYRSEADSLLLMGDPILIGAAVTLAAEHDGIVNVLKYDRQTSSYNQVCLNFNDSDGD